MFPPRSLIARAMNLAVVDPAQGNHEFITHLAAQRSRLHEAEVVGIGVLSPAHKTRLFRNKSQMLLVAMATELRDRKNALVDPVRRLNVQLDRCRRTCRKCRTWDDFAC